MTLTDEDILSIPVGTLVSYLSDSGNRRYCKVAEVSHNEYSNRVKVWGAWRNTIAEAMEAPIVKQTKLSVAPYQKFRIEADIPIENWKEIIE